MSQTIEWQDAAGANAVVLVGAGDSLASFTINGQAAVQVRAAVSRLNAKPIGRGNTTHRVGLAVRSAEYATPAAAREAQIESAAALAAAALDRVKLVGTFDAVTWQLADAVLESHSLALVGRTIVASYVFVGGALSIVP